MQDPLTHDHVERLVGVRDTEHVAFYGDEPIECLFLGHPPGNRQRRRRVIDADVLPDSQMLRREHAPICRPAPDVQESRTAHRVSQAEEPVAAQLAGEPRPAFLPGPLGIGVRHVHLEDGSLDLGVRCHAAYLTRLY